MNMSLEFPSVVRRLGVVLSLAATIPLSGCKPKVDDYAESTQDRAAQARQLILSTDSDRLVSVDRSVFGTDCNDNGILDFAEIAPKPFALDEGGEAHPVPDQPSAVAAGDFDNDGDLDLAVTQRDSDSVAILLNDGNGIYELQNAFPSVGDQPISVTTADFNGDSYDDLAVANHGGATLSVLRSNGDGSFASATTYGDRAPIGYWAAVVSADLDEDGSPDLAFAYHVDGNFLNLVVLWNAGDGTFPDITSVENFESHSSGGGLAVADLDGDGDQDVAVGLSEGRVALVRNDGSRSLGPIGDAGPYTIGSGPLAAADLTGDGRAEVVASKHVHDGSDHPQGLTVSLLGESWGDITETHVIGLGTNPAAIALADLDNDGLTDIVVADRGEQLRVLLNKGEGSFEAARPFPIGHASGIVAAELDGRSPPDLAVARGLDDRLSIWFNQSRISRDANANQVPDDCDIASGSSMDCNANGMPDEVDVLTTLDFSPRQFGVAASPFGYDAGLAHLAISRDEHLDLVLVDMFEEPESEQPGSFIMLEEPESEQPDPFTQQQLSFAINRGDGAFNDPTQAFEGLSNVRGSAVAAADFYPDDRDDLVVALNPEDEEDDPELRIYVYRPRAPYSIPWSDLPRRVPLDHRIEQVVAANLDDEENVELIVIPQTVSGEIEIIRNESGEPVRATSIPLAQLGAIEPPSSVTVADLNGQGGPELIFSMLVSEEIAVCENGGNLKFPSCTQYPAGIAPRMVKAGDVDGDGRLDLVVANDYSGTVSVLRNSSGDFSVSADAHVSSDKHISADQRIHLGEPSSISLGPYARIYPKGLIVSDLDKDGDTDIATANWFSGNVSLLANQGAGEFSEAVIVPAGYKPEAIDMADVDDDGREDLIVGNGNETFTVLYNRSRAPVSLDEDGDGRPDECH